MKKLGLILVFAVFLTGCSEKESFSFEGKSDNWTVEYKVETHNGVNENKNGHIIYTGDGEAPEEFNYTLETRTGGSSGSHIGLVDGKGEFGKGQCGNCAVARVDDKIEVEIEWEGQKEQIILNNEK